jgi:hypothetical protein
MLSIPKYKSACHKYRRLWKTSDDVLYDLCKAFPHHEDRAGTNAKLWLIGRAYATGIERQIENKKRTQSNSIEQLSYCIWRNRSGVDKILKRLKTIHEPLNEIKLNTIVQAHWELLRIVKRITRGSHTPRSFVSKYLHFHNPVVPIYDKVVVSTLTGIMTWRKWGQQFGTVPFLRNTDEDYRRFVFYFWQLYQEIPTPRKKGSVKLLDVYLLELARQKHIRKS